MDWRDNAANLLVAIGTGMGMSAFRQDEVSILLSHLAKQDKKIRQDDRIGFAYICQTYSEKGMTSFLNLVRSRWPESIGETKMSQPRDDGKLECCLCLHLNQDNYQLVPLLETIKTYLEQHAKEAEVEITDCCRSFAAWYDLKIAYRKDLSLLYQLLSAFPWVLSVVTKPACDYGKATAAVLN